MKYMLDTNICIFMLKHVPNVLAVFEKKKNKGIAISSIVLAELEHGVYNSNAYEKNRDALIAFLPLVEVFPFGSRAANMYGQICTSLQKQGRLISPMDMLIGAHAKAEGLILVTNNTREFSRVANLELEDWVI